MIAIVVLGLLAFLFCLVLTPVCRDAFLRAGRVDVPDDERRFHKVPVPRCGGVSVTAAYFASVVITTLLVPGGLHLLLQYRTLWLAILPSAAIIFFVGLRDDLHNLTPKQKLAGQVLAALVAVSFGARMNFNHGPSWVGFAFSVIWLLICTNAVNLIDGMDGLASGVGLTSTLTVLIAALISGNLGLAMATAPLVGALLAFLRYNFTPASVFLGDCGSLTVGFLLGCFGLFWNHHSGAIGLVGPLMALALPLLDVGLAIIRRYLRRVPIFEGDRGHIHHRVLDLGFSTRGAALLLYSCCALSAMLGLLHSFGRKDTSVAISGVFIVFVLVGVHRLRFVEFSAARRILSHRKLRQALREEIYMEEMRRALLTAESAEECWIAVSKFSDRLQFTSARLRIGDRSFGKEAAQDENDLPGCTIHIPLGPDNYLTFTGTATTSPQVVTTVLPNLQFAMREKVQSLNRTSRPLTELT